MFNKNLKDLKIGDPVSMRNGRATLIRITPVTRMTSTMICTETKAADGSVTESQWNRDTGDARGWKTVGFVLPPSISITTDADREVMKVQVYRSKATRIWDTINKGSLSGHDWETVFQALNGLSPTWGESGGRT